MEQDYASDLAKVTNAVQALGYERINPESLTALQEETKQYGWSVVPELSAHDLRGAYNRVMASFRALLGPV